MTIEAPAPGQALSCRLNSKPDYRNSYNNFPQCELVQLLFDCFAVALRNRFSYDLITNGEQALLLSGIFIFLCYVQLKHNSSLQISMSNQFDVPVLFIIFNSPKTTQVTFNQIKQCKPKYLYVAADGPRPQKSGDKQRCEQTRDILKQIDWDCELKTLFRADNSGGAGPGVSSAIDWFFAHVTEGIIFEYDCAPHPEFFLYCEELLERYRQNEKVMFIGGNNFQDGIMRGTGSYYFSPLAHIWGWATWRHVWAKYRFDLKGISKERFHNTLTLYFKDRSSITYWKMIFLMLRMGRIDTWDYQLMFSIWLNGGLAVIPNVNLVSHVVLDDGEEGTYFTTHREGMTNIPTDSIMPLLHPSHIDADQEAYDYHSRKFNYHRSIFELAVAILKLYIPDVIVRFIKKSFIKEEGAR